MTLSTLLKVASVTAYLADNAFLRLVDRLIAAASTLLDDPQLVERDEIVLALTDFDIWPEHAREPVPAA